MQSDTSTVVQSGISREYQVQLGVQFGISRWYGLVSGRDKDQMESSDVPSRSISERRTWDVPVCHMHEMRFATVL
jgi:hypothetical protein